MRAAPPALPAGAFFGADPPRPRGATVSPRPASLLIAAAAVEISCFSAFEFRWVGSSLTPPAARHGGELVKGPGDLGTSNATSTPRLLTTQSKQRVTP
jgi:hypothetical protein